MKHVNGDMEDLFRRAAARYPLRTDSADWDRLAAALDKDPGPPSDTDKDNKRRRRGIFWWWLLLPLAVGLGIYGWRAGRTGAATKEAATQEAATQRAKTQGAGTQAGVKQGAGTQGAGTQGAKTQAGGSSAGEARPLTGTAKGGGISAQPGGTSPGAEAGPAGGMGSTAMGRMRTARSTPGGTRPTATATEGTRLTGSPAGESQPTGLYAEAGGMGGGSVGKKGENDNREAADAALARLDWRRVPTAGSFNLAVDVKAPAARKDSSAKQTKKATAKSNGGHGYIGITGAPDFSTVKMQAMKGVGTTWGLLLGYAFNSRWAVESGVYLDRKKYYSAGEYFDKSDITLYGTETLQSATGTCNMWEVPLNVRYNFNPGSKISWFATAGFSSYFMTKQNYSYDLESSSGNSRIRNWSTSVPANYLFSIVNVSGGFEQRIGKIGNLRVEPYLRLPLSGIGTGHLPIMSAGLNIGITHQLW